MVLHAHSTWSYDGHWPLARIARFYGALGVDAVMMSEHDTGFAPDRFAEYRDACAAASTARCTLIPGIEYSSPDNDVHILSWGVSEFLAEHRPVSETLEGIAAQGGVAIFAHPVRRDAWRLFDPAWVPHLAGIELWNRKSDGITIGAQALALIRQTGLPATVGQDFHKLRHAWPLSMRASGKDVSEAALVADLAAGAMTPEVFRRPLLSPDGTPRVALHNRLESTRKSLRDLVRGRKA